MWKFSGPHIHKMVGEPVRKSKNFKMLMMNKKTGLIAVLAGFAAGGAMANTLTNYATGDVLVCFRNGGNDMVVDAGPISNFTNASPNQVIPISQFTGDQLAVIGTNGTTWSAFTWLSDSTLFITRPRVTPNVQTIPWQAKSSSSQHNTILRMGTIPTGAADSFNAGAYAESTPASVLEPDSSSGNPIYVNGVSYHDAMVGSFGGNFNQTFQGNPENTTTNDISDPTQSFTGAGQVQRSDFYQLTPTFGVASGKFLGYFELNTNGALNFVAYPIAVSIPVISSISYSNGVATINYTTGVSGTYTLRATNLLNSGVPAIQWPAVSVLSSGDNLSHSVQVNDTNTSDFYIITAQ